MVHKILSILLHIMTKLKQLPGAQVRTQFIRTWKKLASLTLDGGGESPQSNTSFISSQNMVATVKISKGLIV